MFRVDCEGLLDCGNYFNQQRNAFCISSPSSPTPKLYHHHNAQRAATRENATDTKDTTSSVYVVKPARFLCSPTNV